MWPTAIASLENSTAGSGERGDGPVTTELVGLEFSLAISGLNGQFVAQSRTLQLQKGKTYRWQVQGFSQQTVAGLAEWLNQLPEAVHLKKTPLKIQKVEASLPATTYAALGTTNTLSLNFLSPTSFRRKGITCCFPGRATRFMAIYGAGIISQGTRSPKMSF